VVNDPLSLPQVVFVCDDMDKQLPVDILKFTIIDEDTGLIQESVISKLYDPPVKPLKWYDVVDAEVGNKPDDVNSITEYGGAVLPVISNETTPDPLFEQSPLTK
jgi:hypothetical protein